MKALYFFCPSVMVDILSLSACSSCLPVHGFCGLICPYANTAGKNGQGSWRKRCLNLVKMLLLAHCFLKAFSDFSIIVCHFSVIRLTILSSLAQDENRKYYYRCRCVCGKEKSIKKHLLLNGESRSCGCRGKGKNDEKGQWRLTSGSCPLFILVFVVKYRITWYN